MLGPATLVPSGDEDEPRALNHSQKRATAVSSIIMVIVGHKQLLTQIFLAFKMRTRTPVGIRCLCVF